MVTSGTHVNGGCCFDYGNAETNSRDTGNGHMDAINFGTECWFAPCYGSRPLGAGGPGERAVRRRQSAPTPNNHGNNSAYVTAMLKNNGTTTYAIKGGNAQSGGLTTWYTGALPNLGGYAPMHQEGAIVLGTGGDNSNGIGRVVLRGRHDRRLPDRRRRQRRAGQHRLRRLRHGRAPARPARSWPAIDSADCVDNNNGSATPGNKVQMWTCDGNTAAQNWTVASNGTLQIDGGCMDITGAKTANGTLIEWWTCNGGANQQWQSQNGELVNPSSGKCLDDPDFSTTNGTQLVLWTCNGGTNQHWQLP